VLSPDDAKRLGINLNDLHYDRFYETANGHVRGSSIQIVDLKIRALHLKNIRASVNEAIMQNSLLGMTFFKRLKGYEVKMGCLLCTGIQMKDKKVKDEHETGLRR
jgi:aspartyl protease family protein